MKEVNSSPKACVSMHSMRNDSSVWSLVGWSAWICLNMPGSAVDLPRLLLMTAGGDPGCL